jgi:hypothetical protein
VKDDLKKKDEQIEMLSKKSEALEKHCAKLVSANKVLLNNISCLFKTAHEEISRKDAEIARLREQLARVPK